MLQFWISLIDNFSQEWQIYELLLFYCLEHCFVTNVSLNFKFSPSRILRSEIAAPNVSDVDPSRHLQQVHTSTALIVHWIWNIDSIIYLTVAGWFPVTWHAGHGFRRPLCPLHTFGRGSLAFLVAPVEYKTEIAASRLLKSRSQVVNSTQLNWQRSGRFGPSDQWRSCCKSLLVSAHSNGYVWGKYVTKWATRIASDL